MRRKAFDHLQKLSFRFYDEHKTGHLLARVTKDLEEIGEVAHHGPEDLFIAVMTLIGAFALMMWVHPPLALMTAVHRSGDGMGDHPIRRSDDADLAGALWPRWRLQRTPRGEYRRHARRTGLRQRGFRAVALRPGQRGLPDDQTLAYRIMAASTSLSYMSMRLIQVVVMIGGSYFVIKGDLERGAGSSASCFWSTCSCVRSRRSTP